MNAFYNFRQRTKRINAEQQRTKGYLDKLLKYTFKDNRLEKSHDENNVRPLPDNMKSEVPHALEINNNRKAASPVHKYRNHLFNG